MAFDRNRIRFGRHIEHDERSREYGVTIRDGARLGSVEWKRYSKILDQGDLGSCTGNAMCGWLGCSPHVSNAASAAPFDEAYAVKLYSLATKLDTFPGTYPPTDTGSSGLAVAKAAQQLHDITAYRHAFSLSGLLTALQTGPVIVGTVWTSNMFSPDAQGFVRPRGAVEGGHEWLVRGVHMGTTASDQWLIADNSWGEGWGPLAGSFRIRLTDMTTLLRQQGDVTVPVS